MAILTNLLIALTIATSALAKTSKTTKHTHPIFQEKPDPALALLTTITNHEAQHRGHMLYSYDQQVRIFELILGSREELEMLKKQLKTEPDDCDTIEVFESLVYDTALSLLAHGAGREHDGMRAFIMVLHVRSVMKAALKKMSKSVYSPITETVCIDRAFLALYSWVRGVLTARAVEDHCYIKDDRPTDEQILSREDKRKAFLMTPLSGELDLDRVMPRLGTDYNE